jgi:Tfp pilus assembly protein PilF
MNDFAPTLEEAARAFQAGQLNHAEDICREVLAKDERSAGAWHLMGKMAALQETGNGWRVCLGGL